MLEIYNETVLDLLSEGREGLDIRQVCQLACAEHDVPWLELLAL